MTRTPRQMNLNMFLATAGYQAGAWRRDGSRSDELLSLTYLADLAQAAERAKMDGVFIADSMAHASTVNSAPRLVQLEPLTALAAIAAVTSRIGLIGTFSTTFTEPFNLSRYLMSLDHLSNGRAGWNIVTSAGGEQNFGGRLPSHDDRYLVAEEYLDVVTALWDSWDDDAVVNSRTEGVWARTDRIHPIHHHGKYYDVAGPAFIPRSPQGWPVLVQAGSSPTGIAFAAQRAEVVFTAQPDLEHARSFYARLKDEVAATGRDAAKVKVLPGFMPIIGDTETAARSLADELAELITIDVGMRALATDFGGTDLTGLDLDEPVPVERIPAVRAISGNQSRFELYRELAVEKRYTLRSLVRVAGRSMGHSVVVGTPEQVADEMEAWFTTGGCDGFNLQMAYAPGGAAALCEQLVPELVDRGLFRAEYTGTTFRDHLGLDRPEVQR
ncbi:LLM class flavin-dependent oxidoreductase [Pseudonocardia oroxyli]|uniref:FMN-dependent oxidoreductase, nitrilotriacetate monooxygenase family n=1 Tax=Pseudonocardia oroxyli TaxID=366584 RepID=A0A1G7Y1T1_PSEOR|nr:LLM class flavin-dependent oxidoreductase [Pseudonocardia oroxyli]SDG90389.1 FMN-dependent oxidoreductase, nitrilotriacetate monooxygenase family [Pseudonocardia oroxyli]